MKVEIFQQKILGLLYFCLLPMKYLFELKVNIL